MDKCETSTLRVKVTGHQLNLVGMWNTSQCQVWGEKKTEVTWLMMNEIFWKVQRWQWHSYLDNLLWQHLARWNIQSFILCPCVKNGNFLDRLFWRYFYVFCIISILLILHPLNSRVSLCSWQSPPWLAASNFFFFYQKVTLSSNRSECNHRGSDSCRYIGTKRRTEDSTKLHQERWRGDNIQQWTNQVPNVSFCTLAAWAWLLKWYGL